jgi:uncharacterized protein (TIGR03118 family)
MGDAGRSGALHRRVTGHDEKEFGMSAQKHVGPWGCKHLLGAGVVVAVGMAAGPALGQYVPHILVSDGAFQANHTDPNLVNSWGLAFNPTGFAWVADNQTGKSTLYDGSGTPQSLVVSIPSPGGPRGGSPTGIVFSGGDGFVVSDGRHEAPARFIFVGEDGIISGWAPQVPPGSTQAQVAIDDSDEGAIYKGLALSVSERGDRIYTTDFHNNSVDAYDESFTELNLDFTDPSLPAGYAPFNIQAIGDSLFVTYALQDKDAEDDVPGRGHGFVNEFDRNGELIRRFASEGVLNSPWGLALAPADFGPMSGALLVGNFGDGRINAFDVETGEFLGALGQTKDRPIVIDGLWSLQFGNGFANQPTNTLFFTAGPDDETHGLYGRIDAASACAADCNDDGVLDITDFVCFQGQWQARTPAGDCDANGVFDVVDFVCFETAFLAGCP